MKGATAMAMLPVLPPVPRVAAGAQAARASATRATVANRNIELFFIPTLLLTFPACPEVRPELRRELLDTIAVPSSTGDRDHEVGVAHLARAARDSDLEIVGSSRSRGEARSRAVGARDARSAASRGTREAPAVAEPIARRVIGRDHEIEGRVGQALVDVGVRARRARGVGRVYDGWQHGVGIFERNSCDSYLEFGLISLASAREISSNFSHYASSNIA